MIARPTTIGRDAEREEQGSRAGGGRSWSRGRSPEVEPGSQSGQTGRAVVDFTVFMLISVRSEATPGSSPSRFVNNCW
jgi:hypothetical protein